MQEECSKTGKSKCEGPEAGRELEGSKENQWRFSAEELMDALQTIDKMVDLN